MSLKTIVINGKCNDLHAVVDTATTKFIVYTRCDDDDLVFCVTNGYDVWRLQVDKDGFETLRDLSSVNTDAFLHNISTSFTSGDIQISQVGVCAKVILGSGSKQITLELFEAKAVDKKMEMQNLLFFLAEKVTDTEKELSKTQSALEKLEQQKASGSSATGIGGAFDISDGKRKLQAKTAPKKVGMSIINPASRKRKAPRGVQFD